MRKDKDKEKKLPVFMQTIPTIQIREGDPEPEFVRKVDEFIERYYDGDYVINRDEAFKIPYGIDGKLASLGHYLSFYLSSYVVSKSQTLERKYGCAFTLFSLITHAFAANVIKKGDGLITKLKECEEQGKRLKKQMDKLKKKCLNLENENKELHSFLDRFGDRSIVEQ